MEISNIIYDGPTEKELEQLPDYIEIPLEVLNDWARDAEDYGYEPFFFEEYVEDNNLIADYISDLTGWCVADYELD